MANDEHLDILKQGVEVWNRWRDQNSDIQPDLRRGDFRRTNLHELNLQGADLRWVNLHEANLRKVNLRQANLRRAILREAIFYKVDLGEADLSKADLSEANLNQVNLSGAYLIEAFMGYTTFGDVDFGEVRGLEMVKHHGPSIINIHTIYHSKDKIPEVFLKGVGLPDILIKCLTRTETSIEIPYTFEQIEDWLSHQQELLTITMKNIGLLEEQKAKYGLDVPLSILHQLDDNKTRKEKLEIEIIKFQKFREVKRRETNV